MDAQEKTTWKARLAGLLLSLLIRLIFYTSKKNWIDLHHLTDRFDEGRPIILVAWHNRNILSAFGYLAHKPEEREWSPMASASKDGTIASEAMRHLGVTCVRGSSSRRGMRALREMVKLVRSGNDLGITPDGPRGPKYKVQEGVVTSAKLTGAVLVPVSYDAKRKKVLDSWDGMIVPYPFNELNYVYGEPIEVPRDAEDVESYRLRLEEALMDTVRRSEQFPVPGDRS